MTVSSDLKGGDFRYPISIRSLSPAKDEYGASTNDWSTVVRNCRASFDPIIGKEYFAADEAQSQVEVKFRTRYTNNIDDTMRIYLYTGVVYEILSVIDVGGNRKELLMYCKKVKNGV